MKDQIVYTGTGDLEWNIWHWFVTLLPIMLAGILGFFGVNIYNQLRSSKKIVAKRLLNNLGVSIVLSIAFVASIYSAMAHYNAEVIHRIELSDSIIRFVLKNHSLIAFDRHNIESVFLDMKIRKLPFGHRKYPVLKVVAKDREIDFLFTSMDDDLRRDIEKLCVELNTSK